MPLKARFRPPESPWLQCTRKRWTFRFYITGLGSVTPVYTVTVKSRVDGQLMEVLYREGQMVNQGDLLAMIDPRPFQVQLTQAEGQLARDQALLKNAIVDLERYQVLWKEDSIQKQQLDTQEALVRQYEGVVKTDQGAIDNAKLQLVYCRITSPITGRVGLRLVDPGNIVHATDANGSRRYNTATAYHRCFSDLGRQPFGWCCPSLKPGNQLAVEAYDRDEKHKLAEGVLLTIDNQVDPTTGTVRFKAMFPETRMICFSLINL